MQCTVSSVPIQTTVGDSQCKKLIASAQLAIFLSPKVVFNPNIILLWVQCYLKCFIFVFGNLITFIPGNSCTQGLEMPQKTVTSQAWSVCMLGQSQQSCLKPLWKGDLGQPHTPVPNQHSHSHTHLPVQIPLENKGTLSAIEVTANIYNIIG